MFDNFKLSKKTQTKILKIIGLIVVLGLGIFSIFSFSEKRCNIIKIDIVNKAQNPFLTEDDILYLAKSRGSDILKGKLMKDIDLKDIERKILKNNLVESCQVHAGMGVTLFIDVKLQEPIARFSDDKSGYYVNKMGNTFQLSRQYTSRVLMLTGGYFKEKKTLKDKFYEDDVLQFINRINDEAFWKAQITQIDVDSSRNINLVPLIGNHTVAFGRPINIEDKLGKLKYFYKSILPNDKFNNFKKISVQFKGQIVCE